MAFQPLRNIPTGSYTSDDVLVIFGEVFSRGYVNGLIEAAQNRGMKVIYSTVGRRDIDGSLRPLTASELAEKDQLVINIPLEAGFDLDVPPGGMSPVQQLEGIKLSEWLNAKIDLSQMKDSQRLGTERFRKQTQLYIEELIKHVPPNANVLFAHTMAGGVPRARVIMPVMNRVFKGHGDRYASSEEFWKSDLGRLCDQNFMEVTAKTLEHLIELSAPLRQRQEKSGKRVSYVAYGYHGTEILIGDEYKWQSYSPYLQGFAKIELENIAARAFKDGVAASVFNAPEILTNSSSIFLGVEVALYPLLGSFLRENASHPFTRELVQRCNSLLKEGESVQSVLEVTNRYFQSDLIGRRWSQYESWPQHNGPEQMSLMRETSQTVLSQHRDERELLTAVLSEIVFRSCGEAMLCEGSQPRQPIWWIGHDLVTKLQLRN